ncbi:MAG: histone deacetylase [Syntrophales bacterium]|nr:histone deacetylase [Syntrophales bacterium]
MLRKTGIVTDARYMEHGAGFYHPESPERLAAIYRMLEQPDMAGKFVPIPSRLATHEELTFIHHPSYIDSVAATAGRAYTSLDPDTATTAESFTAARLAVGGLLDAIDSVVSGETDNAFALVRPPGHHAEADAAMGFCLFNNVAIGAMHAIKKHNMEKILIVDWDLHHGNGTQHSFYDDNRVLYFSTHQYPYYPGTGALEENGQGSGAGYTINVPLRPGAGNERYLNIFRKILQPVALKFKPELILVSAGFDIYEDDPLGGMKVTPEGFAYLTRVLMDIADVCCQGRLVMTLEGGYHIQGQTAAVKKVLQEMRDDTRMDVEKLVPAAAGDGREDQLMRRVMDQIKPYWPVF